MTRNMSVSNGVCFYAPPLRNQTLEAMWFGINVAINSVNILAILLNLCFNGFVVYVYLKTRSRQPISNTSLFLLASFDLLQAILPHPVLVALRISYVQNDDVDCRLRTVNETMTAVCSIFPTILGNVVTSERLFAIVYPMRHRRIMTKRCVVLLSSSLFVLWVALVIFLLHIRKERNVLRFIVYLIVVVTLIYCLGAYIKIYLVIRRSAAFVNRSCDQSVSARKLTKHDSLKFQDSRKTSEKCPPSTGGKELMGRGNSSMVNRSNTRISKKETKTDIELGYHHGATPSEWEVELPEIASHQNEALDLTAEKSTGAQSSTKTGEVNSRDNDVITSTPREPSDFEETKSRSQINSKQTSGALLNAAQRRKEKKTILRMMSIVGTLYISQLPSMVFFAYISRHGQDNCEICGLYLLPLAKSFNFFSSVVNPFFYCYRNEHFRISNVWRARNRRSRSDTSGLPSSTCN